MPPLLLQKPRENLKSNCHLLSFDRRVKFLEEGDISNLLHEGETIQERIQISEKGINTEKISSKLNNMISVSNGILPFNEKTLKMLKQKHPEGNGTPQKVLLQGPTQPVHPIPYKGMDEFLILKAALLTKWASGLSGNDADGWRKILTSHSFGTASSKSCKTFPRFVKRLCLEEIKKSRISGFIHYMQIDPIG